MVCRQDIGTISAWQTFQSRSRNKHGTPRQSNHTPSTEAILLPTGSTDHIFGTSNLERWYNQWMQVKIPLFQFFEERGHWQFLDMNTVLIILTFTIWHTTI